MPLSSSPCLSAVSSTSLMLPVLLVPVAVVVFVTCCLWKSWESARARKISPSRAGGSSLPSPIAMLPRWFGLLGGHTLQIHPEKVSLFQPTIAHKRVIDVQELLYSSSTVGRLLSREVNIYYFTVSAIKRYILGTTALGDEGASSLSILLLLPS